MKTEILSTDGKKIKEIELPSWFSETIREDIVKKVFEAEKTMQPYGPSPMAGRRHSASGRIRHIRHKWRTAYGKGISRVPRKTMWRRGTQFYWIGAEVSGTRGGRRAHPPKPESMINDKKINAKEQKIALKSAIAGTASEKNLILRYDKISKDKMQKLPIVAEGKITELKTKELALSLKKILGGLYEVALPEKKIRAGKGKMRNRKYKKSRGMLIITGKNEKMMANIAESKKINEIEVSDLYPLGRLAVYTENAIKEIENMESRK